MELHITIFSKPVIIANAVLCNRLDHNIAETQPQNMSRVMHTEFTAIEQLLWPEPHYIRIFGHKSTLKVVPHLN